MKKINLHVIQSLEKDDWPTGEELLNRLDADFKSVSDVKFQSTIAYADTPEDFLKELESSSLDVDAVNIIQLDLHGCKDGSGLMAANGKAISQEEILKVMGELYSRCPNGLYLNVAACKGLSLMEGFNPTALLKPFDGIIAPTGIIKDVHALRYSEKFCMTMIETGDFNLATKEAKKVLESNSMENILSGKNFKDFY